MAQLPQLAAVLMSLALLSSVALHTALLSGQVSARRAAVPLAHCFRPCAMTARYTTEARGRPNTDDYRLFLREYRVS